MPRANLLTRYFWSILSDGPKKVNLVCQVLWAENTQGNVPLNVLVSFAGAELTGTLHADDECVGSCAVRPGTS